MSVASRWSGVTSAFYTILKHSPRADPDRHIQDWLSTLPTDESYWANESDGGITWSESKGSRGSASDCELSRRRKREAERKDRLHEREIAKGEMTLREWESECSETVGTLLTYLL